MLSSEATPHRVCLAYHNEVIKLTETACDLLQCR